MQVLVITADAQGAKPDDFCWATEGELALFPAVECDCGDACGCNRAFDGELSHRGSTTAKVVDLPIGRDEFHSRVRESRRQGEWLDRITAADAEQWIADQVSELLGCARRLPVGAVIERRKTMLWVRESTTRGGRAVLR